MSGRGLRGSETYLIGLSGVGDGFGELEAEIVAFNELQVSEHQIQEMLAFRASLRTKRVRAEAEDTD